MKKPFLLLVIVTGLVTMSFESVKSSKIGILKTELGYELTNADKLSLYDLKLLNEMTHIGAKTTTVANTVVYKDAVNQTVYQTSDQSSNTVVEEKLGLILAKY